MFDFKVSTLAHYDDACRKFASSHDMEDDELPLCVMKITAEVGQLAAGAISTKQLSASCKRSLLQNVNSGIRCLTLTALAVQARR
ncbi:phage regulatory CII family protein [Pantoea sp. USHLN256]|uniref:phage regulatory CII family protein n=1 Tax=Pantoea sp. USHLN256 TaxID=3081293 RepID=UPI0030158A20